MMLDFDSLLVRKDESQELIKFDMIFSSRMLEAGARLMPNSTESPREEGREKKGRGHPVAMLYPLAP
ncbi:hypothetical protein J2129_000332 [Methanofollis sp. W23]|nr:hypothetical protein [Methanofollis sp. W23]